MKSYIQMNIKQITKCLFVVFMTLVLSGCSLEADRTAAGTWRINEEFNIGVEHYDGYKLPNIIVLNDDHTGNIQGYSAIWYFDNDQDKEDGDLSIETENGDTYHGYYDEGILAIGISCRTDDSTVTEYYQYERID